jgi:ABC-type nickel/cobalt efflux system permease component RcnA
MEDVVKTLVQASTALVLMTILVLVASMNTMHVQQVHAAMELPALIMVLVTLASVHMGILVSFANCLCVPYRFTNNHDYRIML